nr:xylulose kinase-1 [Tanacetum cinerariifolium]
MSTPAFAETHNLIAFLEKPAESVGFKQIINFLKSKPIQYALTVNATIYVSCVKQFWTTTKMKKVNDQEQIQALVDKIKVIITEDSIRSDLHFDDAEGTACLLNEAIFEGLERMGAKTTAWNEFNSTMAYAIICLADNQKFNFSKYIFNNMVKTLEGGVKFYLFLRFLQVFLDKQVEGMERHKKMYIISSHTKKIFANMRRIRAGFSRHMRKQRKETEVSHDELEDEDHVPTPSSDSLPSAKAAQAKEIAGLNKKVSKLNKWRKSRSRGLRRLKKIGSGRRVKSPIDKDGLGAQDNASKQGRVIKEINQNAEIALDTETLGRTNNNEMFRVNDHAREELVMENTTGVKDSAAPTTDVTEDEIIMAQALAALKSTKPKVVVQAQEMSTTITAAATTVTTAILTPRAKGKAKMIEPEVPIKKKDQMRIDEEYARKLEAKEQEAAMLSRAQQDEEANNF